MMNSTKAALRDEARARRARLESAAPDTAKKIAANFLATIPLPEKSTIAGYIAAHDEIDPAFLIAMLRKRGHAILLPRVAAKDGPLAFHLWRESARAVKGAYGLLEAAPDWPLAQPDIVLVPLLAFDADGFRLGYGGGYYDRSLLALRQTGKVTAVGLAYDGQRIAHIPSDATDEKLDWVVTEKSARKFG
jgi:5-formyltetrahydrofolate cyclo-ligase